MDLQIYHHCRTLHFLMVTCVDKAFRKVPLPTKSPCLSSTCAHPDHVLS